MFRQFSTLLWSSGRPSAQFTYTHGVPSIQVQLPLTFIPPIKTHVLEEFPIKSIAKLVMESSEIEARFPPWLSQTL